MSKYGLLGPSKKFLSSWPVMALQKGGSVRLYFGSICYKKLSESNKPNWKSSSFQESEK